MQRALAEVVLLGARRRRARLLGRPLRLLLRGRVARPLDLPRAGARRDRRRAAAARRRPRRSSSPRWRSRSPRGSPGISRDVAVAVVVTTMFGLGVLLALSPDSPPGDRGAALRRHLRRSPTPTWSPPRRSPRWCPRRAAAAARPPAREPASTAAPPRSLGPPPALVDAALLVLLAAADRRRRAGARQPARRRRLRRPGRGRAPAQRPDRADDRARRGARRARRRRRPLPLLLRGHRRRRLGRAGDRRRLPAGPLPHPSPFHFETGSRLRRRRPDDGTAGSWSERALAALSEAGFRSGGGRRKVVELVRANSAAP